MILRKIQTGFTLIEITIVIALVSILTAIAIPSYYQYIQNTQRSACLSEVKNYSNNVFTILNDQDEITVPTAPAIIACYSVTNATDWTLLTQQKIVAIAKSPSNARIECDIPNGAPCVVLP